MDGFIFQIMLIVEPNRVNLDIDRFYNRMIFKYLTEFYTQLGRLEWPIDFMEVFGKKSVR